MANIIGELNAGTITGQITSSGNIIGELTPQISLAGVVSPGTASTRSHPELINRELANQHPIGAITELTEELNVRPSSVISDEEIMAL